MERCDGRLVHDQIEHVRRRGPARSVGGNIASQTPRVIFQPGAVLRHDPGDLQRRIDRAEIHGPTRLVTKYPTTTGRDG